MNNYYKININGIAHIALTVSNVKVSKLFYKKLMPFLGFKIIHESNKSIYFVGCRTGIMLQEAEYELAKRSREMYKQKVDPEPPEDEPKEDKPNLDVGE